MRRGILYGAMPELPDIVVYLDALRSRVVNRTLEQVRILSPFLVRTVEPPIEQVTGKVVRDVQRMGKRIVVGLDDNSFLVFHLMVSGRFRWLRPSAKPPGKITLGMFDFSTGSLVLTEASHKKRASLHVINGEAGLAAYDLGGLEVLEADAASFRAALCRENHTLKRALADPRLFSGIGNTYSDEILHAARLSPIALTSKVTEEEISRLYNAARDTLRHWIDKLRRQFADRFPGPGDSTAFRPDFAAHGRFGHPCPACECPIQRIRYAESEANYCPVCQTGGRVLADRSLSRLLKDDWPRTIDELETP